MPLEWADLACRREDVRRNTRRSSLADEDLIARLKLPSDLEKSVRSVDLFSAAILMRDGTFLLKYPEHSFAKKPHSRLFKADMENHTLRWVSPTKSHHKTILRFSDVIQINSGFSSRFFKDKVVREQRLAIEIATRVRYLRLVATSQHEWRMWMRGLVQMQERAHTKKRRALLAKDEDLKRFWDSHTLTNTGESVDLLGLAHILKDLDVQGDRRYLEMLFRLADDDNSYVVDYSGFQEIIIRLTRLPPLSAYYHQYKDESRKYMIKSEFEAFLTDIQKLPPHITQQRLKVMDTLKFPFSEAGQLTELGFSRIMLSEWNSIYRPDTVHEEHDMTRPLHCYWIKSCIDPFATIIPGFNKRDMAHCLKSCLLSGFRFIRLFVKDGIPTEQKGKGDAEAAEPIVINQDDTWLYLKTVLQIIKEHAFEVSEYPLIVYIKHFCSGDQVAKLGITIKDVLDEVMYVPAKRTDPLPSPKDLIKKMIVCSVTSDLGDASTEEYNSIKMDHTAFREMDRMPGTEWLLEPPVVFDVLKTPAPVDNPSPRPVVESVLHEQRSWFQKVIGLSRIPWLSTNPPPACSPHEVRSISLHGMQVIQNKGMRFLSSNRNNLGIAYPEGIPAVKNNGGFVEALVDGFQIVPLCQQAGGLARTIQRCLFTENRHTGYVLRPSLLNPPLAPGPPDPTKSSMKMHLMTSGPLELSINVVAARQLPRGACPSPVPTSSGLFEKAPNDTLSPYVVVSVMGGRIVSQKTSVCTNNGFDPQWKGPDLVFQVNSPDMEFLAFEVRHYDPVARVMLAASAVRVSSIRPGLRWVALYDKLGRRIPWSGLLVMVQLRSTKVIDRKRAEDRSKKLGLKPFPTQAMTSGNLLSPERRVLTSRNSSTEPSEAKPVEPS